MKTKIRRSVVYAWKLLQIRITYGLGRENLKKEIMVDISKFANVSTAGEPSSELMKTPCNCTPRAQEHTHAREHRGIGAANSLRLFLTV